MGFFDKIKRGLKKTSDAVSESIGDVMAAFVKVDEDLLEELGRSHDPCGSRRIDRIARRR